MRSLSRQIIGIILLSQIAGAILLACIALLHERHTRLGAFDVALMGRSDSLLGAVQDAEDPADNVTIDPTELKLPEDDVYAVYNQDGRLVGTSRAAPFTLIQPSRGGFRDQKAGGTDYRVYERNAMRIIDRTETDGVGYRRPVTIVYASPEGRIWREILAASGFYLLAIAVVLLVTGTMVFALLRKALVPLADLAAATNQLTLPTLAFTAPPSVLKLRELKPLTDVLTIVIARLKESFAQEQRFIGDAAHELKTAVAVVRSTVQVVMLRPRTPDEYVAGLTRVLEDNSRVERLIAQMLSSAPRNEDEGAESPLIDLDLSVRLALEKLASIAEAHAVKLQFESMNPAKVHLSSHHAYLLISNLVMNAIQHSPKEATVRLDLKQTAETVVLTVADSGEGIGADALPHIFKRFYREDRSRSRATGGAGLGLAICKSIVDTAGGQIQITSVPDEGTTVSVTFIAA